LDTVRRELDPKGATLDPPRADSLGLSVSDLSMCFERTVGRDRVRTWALRDVSFRVDAQEFVSVIGPSGCGKSTILRIAAGLQRPSGGELSIGPNPVTGPGTDTATVFQSPGLLPWRTVLDNVALPLELAGVGKRERTARAAEHVELVGLAGFGEHYPRELSGGMQQRVGLARALAVRPRVLLMDEPFGNLDAISRQRMQDELLRIWDQMKTTVVFVTHAIDEAILLSDRVLVMGRGVVHAEIDVDLPRPRSRRTLLSDERTLQLMRRLESLLGEADGAAVGEDDR
jgi:ABC-type nitrate/sulfonate/bicarbonate transport system ATPase subunit